MKHLYKLLGAIFLLPLFSYAQSNYKSGYVVTLKGDTLHGFIDYHEWDRNPRTVQFKKDQINANIENYSVHNTSSFAIDGQEHYERYILPVSQDQVDVARLDNKATITYVTDTVFLRLINKGKYIALYNYIDNIKTRFYLSETGETMPRELNYHVYYNSDESSSVKYINRYRNQLQYVAQKNNINIAGQINQANYTQSDLLKIVQAINGNSSVQFTANKLSGTRWFAGIGISYDRFKLTREGNNDYTGSSLNSAGSTSPKIDIGGDLFTNKNTQRLILRAEWTFTANHYKLSYLDNSNTVQTKSTLDFTQYNNSITPQVIYNIYNQEQLKIFVGAGASLNISLYNHYKTVTSYTDGSFAGFEQDNYPGLSKLWMTFPLRAGIELNKRLEINISYIPPSSIISSRSSSTENITSASYQAGVNYLFGSK